MAAHGYLTHAAQNRRRTIWLILAYVLGFELLGAFVSTMILLIFDEEHTILSDPFGYLLRYGLAIAALAGFIFWRLYRGHAGSVAGRLGIRLVAREEAPRFVDIATAQCLALGVRLPRFGLLEASEPNAITVGEGPRAGMIAVTRGLLDTLDDDELAAVLAHEASHIRLGDTRLLAANHALMRTAVILQTHNPLRLEDWRQMILPLLLPPMLLLMLIGSTATMAAMQLARVARRGLKLGRDHIADGEAVRVTHFPDALIDAIRKVDGRGAFPGSHAVAGLLFDAPADHEGGRRATAHRRVEAITTLGQDMMASGRVRRDTRTPNAPRATFRQRFADKLAAGRFARGADGKPLAPPPTPTLRMLWLRFSDPQAFDEWQNACTDWWEWRVSDRRNVLGLKPAMVLPVALTTLFMAVVHWPADGDLREYARLFNPATMVDVARFTNADRRCGVFASRVAKCDGVGHPVAAQVMAAPAASARQIPSEPAAVAAPENPIQPFLPANTVPLMMLALIIIAIVRPSWLKQLFGKID